MTIRYALSRGEVASGYFYGWKYSSAFRRRMLLLAALVGLISIAIRYLGFGTLTNGDVLRGAIWSAGLLLFMPAWLALRAKTQERVLELTADGIRTTIGERSATIPWPMISFVSDAKTFIIVGGKNMNAFFIPIRTFDGNEAKGRFITEVLSHVPANSRCSRRAAAASNDSK